MAIAKHTEDLASHIPAVHLLINLKYQYLAPSETVTLRGGKIGKVVLESILEEWLEKNNCSTQEKCFIITLKSLKLNVKTLSAK